MAADFIVVNRSKQMGNRLVALASKLLECREESGALVASGDHCFEGGDYSVLEAQFGLAAGTGANALNLLGLINTILNTAADVTGANRLAQLDEFQSRLAGQ